MSEELKLEITASGWRQFLTSRSEMLDAYDQACRKSKGHRVKVLQGRVAEAQFRNWLAGFLPKRFGVTSGYIISLGRKKDQPLVHFDVIIYDQLESPVLWIETSPDLSQQGRSLAIPVEYVLGVIEVKSSLSAITARAATTHLAELKPLLGRIDSSDENYKLYLPPSFCCSSVFFELRKEHQTSPLVLPRLAEGFQLRGLFGGLVLRGEGLQTDFSGRILRFPFSFGTTPKNNKSKIGKRSLLKGAIFEESDLIGPQTTMFTWGEASFSYFAFDLIAKLRGTYDPGKLSSFYGFGSARIDGS